MDTVTGAFDYNTVLRRVVTQLTNSGLRQIEYHTYFPFVPGVSVRTYTDDWLDEQNWKESEPTEFRGKEYTLYEAKQRQRQMETAMRAQREKVQMLQDGDADPDDVMLAKCKYQGQLDEYARFSK